jgi:tetratricopeptide (TPR) repeat protein
VLAQQDHFSEAASCFEEAIATAERLGDTRLSFYYADRGVLGLNRRDLGKAEYYLLKAYHLEKGQIADRYHFVMVLQNLGVLYTHKGELDQARAVLEDAAVIIEANNYADDRAIRNYRLGEIAFLQGAYAQASGFYAQALEQASALNLQRWIFWIRLKSSLAAIKRGDFVTAWDALQQADMLTEEKTRMHSECQFLETQGLLALAQGHLQLARSLLQRALEHARQIEHSAFCCECLLLFGVVCLREGDLDAAHSSLQEGSALADQLGMPRLQGEALLAWGEYALLQQEYVQAQEQFEAVIQTLPHDFLEFIARAHMGLAQIARVQLQYEKARAFGQVALEMFEQMQHVQASVAHDFLRDLPAHV